MQRLMVFSAVFLVLSVPGICMAESLFEGVYMGDLPQMEEAVKSPFFYSYPHNSEMLAGNVYLTRNNMGVVDWVSSSKNEVVRKEMSISKAYAQKKGAGHYAISNLGFDFEMDGGIYYLSSGCQVIVW